jgi:uncharacterized protein YqgC (DUF456 family)
VAAPLGWLLFGAVLLAAIPLQILGLPGTWLLLADAFLLRWLTEPDLISNSTILILACMAASGELVELWTAASGARSEVPVRGAVTAAIIGAIFGGILGAPIFFGLGAIPGMAAGAWSAVFLIALINGCSPGQALRAATGALMGRLRGTAAKIVICVAMVAVLIVSLIL